MTKRLNEMMGLEPYEHYMNVVHRRFQKGYRLALAAKKVTDPMIRKMMIKQADEIIAKANRFARPMRWQEARALKLRDTYGMGVAAGFMRAHGWTANDAHRVLFGV